MKGSEPVKNHPLCDDARQSCFAANEPRRSVASLREKSASVIQVAAGGTTEIRVRTLRDARLPDHISTTHLLELIGLICVLASAGSPRRNWQLMRKPLPEIHQEALGGRLLGRAPVP
jgi:hypothetical protein